MIEEVRYILLIFFVFEIALVEIILRHTKISQAIVKLELKLNTKIGLHTHSTHPPHHKLFEGF